MYTIKEATLADVETIRQLAHEIWWPTYSPILEADQIGFMLADRYSTETLTNQLANNEQTFLLLYADEKPVAFAAYSPHESDPQVYRLQKLYSLPSTKGKGVGKALLHEIYDRVRAAGKSVLELNVHRQNPARSFYEKMGFVIAYEIDIPFDKYFLNDYVMRKDL
ncbi:GNAT family N-acetyltransferase [Mucilaginibacter sp. dw_454]|uniref:GNAT family N-acetyltransferase n=1 Tax=Mucilaginibacter sp. dw_454 TaxID=2720079 RepID=UPI001BD38607|nr:GNAT family N-acetyltransferase [Mucilaginibacter sp. dw_454]